MKSLETIYLDLLVLFCLIKFAPINCLKALTANTTSGIVRGSTIEVENVLVDQYLNIPYAEPPVGKLRFSRPVPLEPLKDIIDGTKIGNSCFQYNHPPYPNIKQSEDCLVLNIWTTRNKAPDRQIESTDSNLKPVMIWIHGGYFWYGSIFDSAYNGSLLATYDVVVVSVQYRLGPFGWFYGGEQTSPGNLGLYDQRIALYWVWENIHLFGGDPKQITLFGQSAGGWSVSSHLLSPLSKGLFKRAIIQSGALIDNKYTPNITKIDALREARAFAINFNCDNTNQWIDCLRTVEAKSLNEYPILTPYPLYGTEFLPLMTQDAITHNQYSNQIEIMAGVTKDEAAKFSNDEVPSSKYLKSTEEFIDLVENLPYSGLNSERIADYYLKNVSSRTTKSLKKAFQDFYSDFTVKCSTYLFAKLFAMNSPGTNVYFYYWTYISRMIASKLDCTLEMGVCHNSDFPYIFGEPVLKNMADKVFSKYVMRLWTNFAKWGNPMADFPSEYQWPRLVKDDDINNKEEEPTKIKEMNPYKLNHIIDNLFADNCDKFWKNYFI